MSRSSSPALPGLDPEIEPIAVAQPRRRSRGPGFDPQAQPWEINPTGLPPVSPDRLTAEGLRRRFSDPAVVESQTSDAATARAAAAGQGLRLASVLVPLVMRPEGVHVMLTQRTAHLHDHAGQISFPGGRVEASDPTLVDAALRESLEETGLQPDLVEVIGRLPDYHTSTGFCIAPVVGLVSDTFVAVPEPFEVAEVFEVPLAFLMDPANHRVHSVVLPHNGRHAYFSMPWQQYFVWGATAGMLRDLYYFLCRGDQGGAGHTKP